MVKNVIEERRHSVRVPRILSIRHRLHKRKGKIINSHWFISITENMSVSGILFNSAAPYLVGDIIELEVVLSGVIDIFRGFARVVRIDKKESGVAHGIAVMLIDFKKKGQHFKEMAQENIRIRKSHRKRK